MNKRDPKVTPWVGDQLRKGKILRTVTGFLDGGAIVKCRDESASAAARTITRHPWPTLSQFRRWAANAEVVSAAPEVGR